MTEGTSIVTIEYLDGFQYKNQDMQFFPHAEGYVNVLNKEEDDGGSFQHWYDYVYNYTDHLGNIRLSYTDANRDGLISDYANNDGLLVKEVLEENHYYPFGLKHKNYNQYLYKYAKSSTGSDERRPIASLNSEAGYKYKYNGKEYQDELDLNVYSHGWRDYDPAIGRFNKLDRFSEKYYSITPYNFSANNPIGLREINGDSLQGISRKDVRRTKRLIRKTFKGKKFRKLRRLFKTKGKNFKGIDSGEFYAATEGLNKNETALAEGYFDAINSAEIHTVEAVRRGEKLRSKTSRIGGSTRGRDVDNLTGGGFNTQTVGGSHTVIIMNSAINIPDYRDLFTGNYVTNMTSSAGELLAHELLGHGLTRFNSGGSQFLNAIQLTNLYHRVTSGISRYYRDGTSHGGTSGVPLSFSTSGTIPQYLRQTTQLRRFVNQTMPSINWFFK